MSGGVRVGTQGSLLTGDIASPSELCLAGQDSDFCYCSQGGAYFELPLVERAGGERRGEEERGGEGRADQGNNWPKIGRTRLGQALCKTK